MSLSPNFNSRAHVERDCARYHKYFFNENFNSRAHVERDAIWVAGRALSRSFQLTRSRGARPPPVVRTTRRRAFQLTRSRGARRFEGTLSAEKKEISTHALTWSATSGGINSGYGLRFQLTRSRGARPEIFEKINTHMIISTHALTWSATSVLGTAERSKRFQLTRSRGARLPCEMRIL